MGYSKATFLANNQPKPKSGLGRGQGPEEQQQQQQKQTSDAIVNALLNSTPVPDLGNKPVKPTYDKYTQKRCIKCRVWKDRIGEHRAFGSNAATADGLQEICHTCKNTANKYARNLNVSIRIRHHTATRCITQLGDSAPEDLTANLEFYLGYKVKRLVDHLREELKQREGPNRSLRAALNEGYHIDHIRPLRLYSVVNEDGTINWPTFRACWAIENLRAIPGQENLEKGGKFDE